VARDLNINWINEWTVCALAHLQ